MRPFTEPVRLPLQNGGQINTAELPPHVFSPGDPEEKRALIAALQQTNGNQTRAARILGINRVTVWNRMKKYGIDLKKVLTT